jgi:hypothetical protein
MDHHEAALLKDLWTTYDMQMKAMQKSSKSGKTLAASLHKKMANQILDSYFDMIDRLVVA